MCANPSGCGGWVVWRGLLYRRPHSLVCSPNVKKHAGKIWVRETLNARLDDGSFAGIVQSRSSPSMTECWGVHWFHTCFYVSMRVLGSLKY